MYALNKNLIGVHTNERILLVEQSIVFLFEHR